jgi:hypothetical protein
LYSQHCIFVPGTGIHITYGMFYVTGDASERQLGDCVGHVLQASGPHHQAGGGHGLLSIHQVSSSADLSNKRHIHPG